MGKKSTPKAPPAPDYAAAATAQGQANLEAARVGAELARTNQYTPYGSEVFTKNPEGDQWSSTISLSPEQQKLYDLQTQGQQTLGETAVSGLGRVQDSFSQPFDTSGAPARVTSLDAPEYSLYGGTPGSPVRSLDFSGAPEASLDFSGLSDLPGAEDFGAQRQSVEDALYRQATNRLDPQFEQEMDQTRTRLINSGVQEGTEAFRNAMDQYQRNRTAAYGDARDRAILAGGGEQSRLQGDARANRAQMLSQALSQGQFGLAAREQATGEEVTKGTFANTAAQQEFDNTLRSLGFNNAAEAQQFIDSVTAGNFQNQQRGAAIDEQAYLRQLPLNEYNALATGAQVTNPNFAGTPGTEAPAPAPTFAATQAADQRAVDLYNQQLASSGGARGGLFGMLGSLGGAALSNPNIFSDRRLKTDIQKIGHMTGTFLPVYSYTIFGQPATGVMADEARMIHPEAVTTHESGYDMVDYSMISGEPVLH